MQETAEVSNEATLVMTRPGNINAVRGMRRVYRYGSRESHYLALARSKTRE
jgi:hypothetical protein